MRPQLPQSAHKGSHKDQILGHRDASRLTRKSGTYYYRRRLPASHGKGEVAVSLSTDRFREAEWLAALLEAEFQRLPWRTMTRAEMQLLLRNLLDRLLEDDQARRIEFRERGRPVFASRHHLEDHDGDIREADKAAFTDDAQFWRDVLGEGDFDAVSETVDEILDGREVTEIERKTLSVGVIEAFIKAREVGEARASGGAFSVLEMPSGPLVPPTPSASVVSASPPVPAQPEKPLTSTLVEPFFVQRETVAKATYQVMGQERGTLRRFIEVCGDRPVNEYGRGDITRFLNTLRRVPSTYGKSPRDKDRPIADIIAQADKEGSERLSDKTVKRHLSALSQFFKFAMDLGHISNAQRTELVEDHAFKEERRARDQRDEWTSADLVKLFKSPVWTGCQPKQRAVPGPEIIRDAKFWLPLLALFHGARLEEFADLRRKDVIRDDEAGGLWAFDLNEEARRLKTDNAVRIVPMHPEIIRLGFLDYVTKTAPKPEDPLFPDLEPQGKDKKRGARFTRDFRYYREAVGVYREGVGMHAFRHTAITRLTNALDSFQARRHRDYMMGHSAGEGEGDIRYDKGPGLKACAETLALLRYPEIDLSHLYVAAEEASR